MTTYSTKSLGFSLRFNGPSSVEDYDKAAGKVGACLEDAVENIIYRGTLPEWQDAFATHLEELTGEKMQVNEKATADAKARSKTPDKVKDVLETVKTYVARVTANFDEDQKKALAATAQSLADGISVDPAPSKRQGPVKKDLLEKADSWLAKGTDHIEAKITQFQQEFPGIRDVVRDQDGNADRESLARFIGAVLDARERAALAEL